ncbi:MAG: hypothetical protein IKO94_00345 [Selenomonadaceae bacterium]|nr:hypothetical protein [Selenomonadaceae bacterium]
MVVNGINVKVNGVPDVSEQEIVNYIGYVEEHTSTPLKSLSISAAENGRVSLDYVLRPQKFERIRRITGYLVGTMDKWNDGKKAEERDRVKHSLER